MPLTSPQHFSGTPVYCCFGAQPLQEKNATHKSWPSTSESCVRHAFCYSHDPGGRGGRQQLDSGDFVNCLQPNVLMYKAQKSFLPTDSMSKAVASMSRGVSPSAKNAAGTVVLAMRYCMVMYIDHVRSEHRLVNRAPSKPFSKFWGKHGGCILSFYTHANPSSHYFSWLILQGLHNNWRLRRL
jgi:hypothetical protein